MRVCYIDVLATLCPHISGCWVLRPQHVGSKWPCLPEQAKQFKCHPVGPRLSYLGPGSCWPRQAGTIRSDNVRESQTQHRPFGGGFFVVNFRAENQSISRRGIDNLFNAGFDSLEQGIY
jgi:hypothetical protein